MSKLYYQGHGSYRFTPDDGRVVYVDPSCVGERHAKPATGPYAGDGYDLPADLILVTHGHHDHNKVRLVKQKPDCRVITHKDALAGGKRNSFDACGITIQAVEAKAFLHSPKRCVGYVLTFDGLKVYCSGDTSKTKQMSELAALNLDYAIFCGGGPAMGLKTAAECARLVGARHNIIVHLKPGALFDRAKADRWDAPNKLIIEPGEEIEL